MVEPGPRSHVLDLIVAFRQTQCLRVAAELEFADHLADGPCSASALAEATGAYEPFLRRLLRALDRASPIVQTPPEDRYRLTALGEQLTAPNLRAVARMFGSEPFWSAWEGLEHAVRTGERGIDHAYGTDAWEYFASHPADAERFDAGMAALTGGSGRAPIVEPTTSAGSGTWSTSGEATARSWPRSWAGPRTPAACCWTSRESSTARRRTLESAGLLDRAELVGGDFRAVVPAGGGLLRAEVDPARLGRRAGHGRSSAGAGPRRRPPRVSWWSSGCSRSAWVRRTPRRCWPTST